MHSSNRPTEENAQPVPPNLIRSSSSSSRLPLSPSTADTLPALQPSWGFERVPSPSSASTPTAQAADAATTSIFSSGRPFPLPRMNSETFDPSAASPSPSNAAGSHSPQAPPTPLSTSVRTVTNRPIRFLESTSPRNVAGRHDDTQKDTDDPSLPSSPQPRTENRRHETPTALTRLFGAQMVISPSESRSDSFNTGADGTSNESSVTNTVSLPDHIYTRGLLAGRYSDITIVAFGNRYALHRLVLDRAPFFATALSEPWLESTSKEVALHPSEVDRNITRNAFELAIRRLYGCDTSEEDEAEAIGLFAVGCWLEMQDLVESSIDFILRVLSPENLSLYIRLVTTNYYGRPGERILASAKAMLCRDGWEMPLRYWDGIPGDVVREIVGGDGLFIHGEWDRWILAKRILDRRLKQTAVDCGLLEPGSKSKIKAPDSLGLMTVRYDTACRRNSVSTGRQSPQHRWLSLYTHPDVEPLLVLLDEGIHYVHLDFQQLQYVRKTRDVFGMPLSPEKIITNALWMSMELRQKVLNARETDMELGISSPTEEAGQNGKFNDTTLSLVSLGTTPSAVSEGKKKISDSSAVITDDDSDPMLCDVNGYSRKFWIPSRDCNIVMGGNAEPIVTTSSALRSLASQISATIQPEDIQWATDFAASPSTNIQSMNRPSTPARPSSSGGGQPKPIAYSHFPPFRFSVEFPNPRLLKERKRVYSRTVFYAGSLWNVYIQKIRSAKSSQLGVYLHRAKDRGVNDIISSTAGQSSVDERISLLEREMFLRRQRRATERETRTLQDPPTDPRHVFPSNDSASGPSIHRNLVAVEGEDTSGSGGDLDVDNATARIASSTTRIPSRPHISSRTQSQPTSPLDFSSWPPLDSSSGSESDDSINPANPLDSDSAPINLQSISSPSPSIFRPKAGPASSRAPIIPAYVDARPTIKTYFKIYSPSKGGRLLSVYESAPDKFNFSQSWGWKSSTLMLDERFDEDFKGADDEGKWKGGGNGKLRFMVVVGNL